LFVLCFGCAGSSGDSQIAATTFDPCQPLQVTTDGAATQVESDGIAGAIALWKSHGAPGLDAGAGPSLPVHFQFAAPLFHGLYDDQHAAIYVNDDLTQVDTLSIVIAHELGHAFGLQHVSPDVRLSVMNPGNLDVAPTDDDRRALESLWGTCTSGS
jgi:hypothetical protein